MTAKRNYRPHLIAILIVSVCSFSACKDDKIVLNEDTILFSEFPEKDTVIFKNMFEFYNEPMTFTIADSTLIMLNFGSSESYLNNYSLKTGQLSGGYLNPGRGPGEALSASDFGIAGNNLWVYDMTGKKILMADKTDILTDSADIDVFFDHYPMPKQYFEMGFRDSLHFLVVNSRETLSKIEEVNFRTGKTTNTFGKFERVPEDVPLSIVKDAYTAYIQLHPSGTKAALPYRYTDVLEIHDLKKGSSIAVQGPEQFDVIYEEGELLGNHYMAKKPETRKAFVKGTVTDKYIYLLYSGHNRTHENWSYGRNIYVYDWEGNPVKKLALDRYIYAFIVSPDDKTIYSFDRETGYMINSGITLN